MTQLLRYAAAGLLGLLAAGPALAQSPALGPWVEAPTQPLLDGLLYNEARSLQLPRPNVVWAAYRDYFGSGKYGTTVVESLDNGLSWQQKFVVSSSTPDFWALDGQRAWLLVDKSTNTTDTQTLYQTTTGAAGLAVAAVQLPEKCAFIRFFTPAAGVAIAYANPAGIVPIYRTTDGGATWALLPATPTFAAGSGLTTCHVLGTHLWAALSNNQLLRSSDMGLTWSNSATPSTFARMAFRDAQHGLGSGYLGLGLDGDKLYQTADGGATWSKVNPSGKIRLNCLVAVPGSPGTYLTVGGANLNGAYDISPDNGTASSRDEGQTWQDLGGNVALEVVAADQTGNAWATVLQKGRLVRFGGTALPTLTPQAATAAAIYPNPTTGRVLLPAAGAHRQVTVYDATGRAVPHGSAWAGRNLARPKQPGRGPVRAAPHRWPIGSPAAARSGNSLKS